MHNKLIQCETCGEWYPKDSDCENCRRSQEAEIAFQEAMEQDKQFRQEQREYDDDDN